MRKRLLAVLLPSLASLVATTAFPDDAHANGRFPQSNAVFFSKNEPDLVLMRATFGLVISHDRGKTWDWVCEESIGLTGTEDPMFAVMPDGTYVGSAFLGLTLSHDKGCSFSFAAGDLAQASFVDLTTRAAEPNRLVAFRSALDRLDDAGAPVYLSVLYETQDQAKTFTRLGSPFDGALLGHTVDLAPSDPDRIYVTGIRVAGTTTTALFLTSRDHGKTYEEHTIALVDKEQATYIAAVDPTNADRVYLRTASPIPYGGDGSGSPGRLLLTEDAGKTWRVLLSTKAALQGFALSRDQSKIFVGTVQDGLNVASTSDFSFKQISNREISCLGISDDGLWACSTERSGFVLGLSKDEGATFEPKLHFCDIRGPVACGADAKTTQLCGGQRWKKQEFDLGCDSSTASDAGGKTPDASAPDGGAASQAGSVTGGSGCSATPGTTLVPVGLAASTAAAIFAFIHRRKRREPRKN